MGVLGVDGVVSSVALRGPWERVGWGCAFCERWVMDYRLGFRLKSPMRVSCSGRMVSFMGGFSPCFASIVWAAQYPLAGGGCGWRLPWWKRATRAQNIHIHMP